MKDALMKGKKMFSIVLSLVGIILILGSISLTIYDYILETKSIKINATIKSLNYSGISSTALIEYKVDEKTYNNNISIKRTDNLTVDDSISVKVNIYEPAKIINNEHLFITIPVIIVSLIVCLISGPKSLKYYKEYKNRQNLKQNGIFIKAQISEVFVNSNASKYKGLYPYRLRCKYQNPLDNQLYIFDSEDTYNNISEVISKYNSQTVTVYLQKGHPENYYIDLSSLLPNYKLIDPIEFMKSSSTSKKEEPLTEETEKTSSEKKDNL